MSGPRLKGLNYVVQPWCKTQKKNRKSLKIRDLRFNWYPEPGSNRHGLLHWCLRPARLPIPPSGLFASGRDWRLFRLVALQVAEGGRPSGLGCKDIVNCGKNQLFFDFMRGEHENIPKAWKVPITKEATEKL